jgi:SAP domain-containing protein
MTLYARSDLMSVSIPPTSGGCGDSHSRPVKAGVPAKTWGLDCPLCESVLRGDHKAKVINVLPGDKDRGIPNRLVHVPDSDPHWSNTPEGIPPTPDEQHVNKIRAERGSEQLQQLQALAMLRGAGFELPEEAQWVLNRNFDPRIVRGTVVCADGHDNVAGAVFCSTCGTRMAAKGILQIGDPDGQEVDISVIGENATAGGGGAIRVDALPLRTLHVSTLKKMCREKGLPDKGTKKELITRLS